MRNASVTCSALAPPPTSRKFAGCPPWYLMMSIVLIAKSGTIDQAADVAVEFDVAQSGIAGSNFAGFFFGQGHEVPADSGWRNSALSSKVIFASRAIIWPSPVMTSGLISASRAIVVDIESAHGVHEFAAALGRCTADAQFLAELADLKRFQCRRPDRNVP